MNRSKELAKNTFILSIGTIFPKTVNIIILPVITAHLTKIEYGTYDLICTLVSLFLPAVTLQIQSAAFRFLIDCRDDEDEKKRIISNSFFFIIPISILALSILFLAMYRIKLMIRVLISIYFLLDIILAEIRQIIRGLSFNKLYSISSAVESLLKVVLIVLFVAGLDYGLNGVLIAFCISMSAGIILLFIRGRIASYVDYTKGSWMAIKQMLAYSWPLVPNSLSNWVLSVSDRLVLTAFIGLEAVAVYSAANKIPQIFALLYGTFIFAWQENASLSLTDENASIYFSTIFDTVFSLLTGILALVIGMSPVLFRLLIRGDYQDAYPQMSILFIGFFFSALSSFIGGFYVAHKKTKSVGFTTLLAAACNLAIDFALVNRIGIYAASVSTLISYLLLAIFRLKGLLKFQEITLRYKKMIFCIFALIGMSGLGQFDTLVSNGLNFLAGCMLAVGLNYSILRSAVTSVSIRLKGSREN